MARDLLSEGTWFAVPLRDGGYAVGVIARANKNGVLLGYFFGPRRVTLPVLAELTTVRPDQAILVGKFGHLGLKGGTWAVLGKMADWDRSVWSMPVFGRFEELTGRAFAMYYSDDDPSSLPRQVQLPKEDLVRYPPDGLSGAGAVEIILTQLM